MYRFIALLAVVSLFGSHCALQQKKSMYIVTKYRDYHLWLLKCAMDTPLLLANKKAQMQVQILPPYLVAMVCKMHYDSNNVGVKLLLRFLCFEIIVSLSKQINAFCNKLDNNMWLLKNVKYTWLFNRHQPMSDKKVKVE